MASRNPEIYIVLDDRGNMSAWGLERVGCRVRLENCVANIAHAEELYFNFQEKLPPHEDYVRCVSFADHDGRVNLLTHFFDGRLEWHKGEIDEILDPSPQPNCLHLEAALTGHAGTIRSLASSDDGRVIVSTSVECEAIAWLFENSMWSRKSIFQLRAPAFHIRIPGYAHLVAFTHKSSLSIWDVRELAGSHVATIDDPVAASDPRIFSLDRPYYKGSILISSVSMSVGVRTWNVSKRNGVFVVSAASKLAFPFAYKPADNDKGSDTKELGSLSCAVNLDQRISDSMYSCDRKGTVERWALRTLSPGDQSVLQRVQTLDSGVHDCAVASGFDSHTAVVDKTRKELTIWNLASGQLEQTLCFRSHETVQHIRWARSNCAHKVLAAIFPHKVKLFAQAQCNFELHFLPWVLLKIIDISELTNLPISDAVWTVENGFVVSAGNQMFSFDSFTVLDSHSVPGSNSPPNRYIRCDMSTASRLLNCSVPVFHHQFLTQLFFAGRPHSTGDLLTEFNGRLKFFSEGQSFDAFIGQHPISFSSLYAPEQRAPDNEHSEQESFDEEHANSLAEKLSVLSIPFLDRHNQDQVIGFVKSYGSVARHLRAIDDCGLRYLLFMHLFLHSDSQETSTDTFNIPWRDMLWAYHSNSQDILVDLTSRQCGGRPLWTHARKTGLFMWMRDINAVVSSSSDISSGLLAQ